MCEGMLAGDLYCSEQRSAPIGMSVRGGTLVTMSELRFTHDPKEQPTDCLDSVLHELAFRANLTGQQRRKTFEHGERAL
jgi:hypothetical protein